MADRFRARSEVFPARAGVFLKLRFATSSLARLPRTGGGVSVSQATVDRIQVSSPHGRGCFYRYYPSLITGHSLPRTGGGVSELDVVDERLHGSSPHGRGCFHGGARSERLSLRLPRTGGGVSAHERRLSRLSPSSPHGRGCFPEQRDCPRCPPVFPARAGVFLKPLIC